MTERRRDAAQLALFMGLSAAWYLTIYLDERWLCFLGTGAFSGAATGLACARLLPRPRAARALTALGLLVGAASGLVFALLRSGPAAVLLHPRAIVTYGSFFVTLLAIGVLEARADVALPAARTPRPRR